MLNMQDLISWLLQHPRVQAVHLAAHATDDCVACVSGVATGLGPSPAEAILDLVDQLGWVNDWRDELERLPRTLSDADRVYYQCCNFARFGQTDPEVSRIATRSIRDMSRRGVPLSDALRACMSTFGDRTSAADLADAYTEAQQ